ncbi:hypothetical protein [Abyssisolibacter fermentans]|uniref:hypothetical protein n=1 Tax=Abyssisolibacter fermentans TaxID=1766203 RepID=UPI00082AF8F4|nr:hypothetical protein [Abyssisolibacter fermentans]
MTDLETADLYEKAIDKFGMVEQLVVAIEELAELQKEITKAIRGKANIKNMTEEIADVLIMIDQVTRMYFIENKDIEVAKDYKLNILKEIVEKRD